MNIQSIAKSKGFDVKARVALEQEDRIDFDKFKRHCWTFLFDADSVGATKAWYDHLQVAAFILNPEASADLFDDLYKLTEWAQGYPGWHRITETEKLEEYEDTYSLMLSKRYKTWKDIVKATYDYMRATKALRDSYLEYLKENGFENDE